MKKKLTISLCTALLLCVLFSLPSVFAAGDQRVYDQAGLFTQAEVQELEESVAEHRKSTQMDIVIVTTDDAQGKTSQAYADDFYDYNGFGEGSDNTGVLLLIDMDNDDYIDLTDDEKLDVVAARIMKRFKPAFEELAK